MVIGKEKYGVGCANIEYIVKDDRKVRDLMEHDCRTRLAETCGTRDESPRTLAAGNRERQSEQTS